MTVMTEQRGGSFLVEQLTAADIVCPEDMNDEERLLMRSIKEFAEQEVSPLYDEIDRLNIEIIRPLFKKAADLGLFMAEVPENLGGLGLSLLAIAGMSECRCYLGGLSSTVFAHQGIGTLPLINFGTEAQIDRYLNPCMHGDLMAAFALTEPGSGSDAMNIATTAVLNPAKTHYIVNGTKQWITNAGWADLFILFAKVDGVDFSAFLLERDTPGLAVGPHEKLLGLQGSSVCGLQLDDVLIPTENLLGEIGKGHKVAMCTLNLGRMKMAANCAGTSKKILETTARYAVDRKQFGHPIADFGLVQRKLSDMAARTYAAESVAYRTAGLVYSATEAPRAHNGDSLDRKLKILAEFSIECAMAKVIGSETYNGVADDALQVYGGNGYSEEYPAARWYRDSRITRIYEGTSEICRLSIAKTLLKRAERGQLCLREAIAELPSPAEQPSGEDLAALRTHTASLKEIFLYVLGEIWDTVDEEKLFTPGNQQLLSSLSDIAMETYLTESTVLRVSKLAASHPSNDLSFELALARLTCFRAADRIRQESTEVLSAVLEPSQLPSALDRVARSLPAPTGLIASRSLVARALTSGSRSLSSPAAR